MVVPWPGWERTARVPPCAASRSDMPCRPEPWPTVSSRPVLLFETMLPTRYYLPRADVMAELVPSPTRTWCAYKGQASYFSASVGGRLVPDIAWSYPDPRHDAARVRDLIAFFDERIDVVLDGERRARPVTPWSDGS
jgi:uncharacterized protein (DUF427 family)